MTKHLTQVGPWRQPELDLRHLPRSLSLSFTLFWPVLPKPDIEQGYGGNTAQQVGHRRI